MEYSFLYVFCIMAVVQSGTANISPVISLPSFPSFPPTTLCQKLSGASRFIGRIEKLEKIRIPKIETLATDIDEGYIAEDLVLTAEEWYLYGLNNMRFAKECPVYDGIVTANIEYSQLKVELVNYTLTGLLVEAIELVGSGDAIVTLEDFKPTLMCAVSKSIRGDLQIDSVEVSLPVKKFVVDFEGFMEGTDLQPLLNEFLSMEGQEILDTIAYVFNNSKVNDLLKGLLNFVLNQVEKIQGNQMVIDPLVEKEIVKRIDQIIEGLLMELTQ